jgi:predicted DNA-binding helix-hairpin-helix protein
VGWVWKWRHPNLLVKEAERLERIEIPVYRSTGGPIFKTLLSDACRMDCRYCPLSRYCRRMRSFWDKSKLVKVFLEAYRRGLVKGLFLSSGLYGDPDRVVEDMLDVVEELRRRGYKGYIHVRLMPGTSPSLIRRAAELADRIGLNLEAPSPSHFSDIAPSKGSWSLDILSRLLYARRVTKDWRRVDTQLVVGASGESDLEILRLVEMLAEQGVRIVHFSPYTPYRGTPLAERLRKPTPSWRTRQLYEARILISQYGFKLEDLEPLIGEDGNLPPLHSTLKEEVARLHPEWFPLDPNTASYRELVRVPGIGPRRAKKIILARENGNLTLKLLRQIVGNGWRKAQRYLDLSAVRG